jgi:dihydroneopterin aldolase
MDTIHLNDLVYEGTHGALDWEKENPQRFRVHVDIKIDTSDVIETDKLEDTVSWFKVRDDIKDVIENESYNLVEKLADRLTEVILDYEKIEETRVTVEKIDIWDNGYPAVTARRES